ncbi:hypothetical protein K458DRAFT_322496 [Lentithecium fluviatile CBS 122367]|uniref:MFS general substrate transporter n=1 Tax=Lentithecium fluviatile CBS 122367 TaxID=1168545 RepID=A0A6G1IDD3_9PLEO|nr:hypothetical protein K458DRAFT_322496 [Lentithecium fluviatile CBS 122367]
MYFLSIKGSSPLSSGVDLSAYALPQIGFTVSTGALATKFGDYVPYLILGTAVSIVGSGLINKFEVATVTRNWVEFLIICGVGTGMAISQPYTAVQAILDEDDVMVGNGRVNLFWHSLSLCISETLFLNKLTAEVEVKTPQIPPGVVIAAGAYDLPTIAQSPVALHNLREAYTDAVRNISIFALVATCLVLIFTFGFDHRNVRSVAEARKHGERTTIGELGVEKGA